MSSPLRDSGDFSRARNAHAIRLKGSESILAVPGGPGQLEWGRIPRVNPGFTLGYAFLATSATDWKRPNSSAPYDAKHNRHICVICEICGLTLL